MSLNGSYQKFKWCWTEKSTSLKMIVEWWVCFVQVVIHQDNLVLSSCEWKSEECGVGQIMETENSLVLSQDVFMSHGAKLGTKDKTCSKVLRALSKSYPLIHVQVWLKVLMKLLTWNVLSGLTFLQAFSPNGQTTLGFSSSSEQIHTHSMEKMSLPVQVSSHSRTCWLKPSDKRVQKM